MDLVQIARMTEEEARIFLESIRWLAGTYCPHCGSFNVTRLEGERHRPGVYQCNDCREQFTVTVGTIMHRSKITLVKWIMAFHLMCSAKKGVSALQLKRQLGIGSYQTAWHLCHRIRFAMKNQPFVNMLGSNGGTVEVDETYVGGKPRKGDKREIKRGRGTKKVAVVALVERGKDGRAQSMPIDHVDSITLKSAIREDVDRSACIMTDEWKSYQGLEEEFKGGHETVDHGKGEYARGRVNTNTVECYFSLFKRGFIGSFHKMSPKHLHRYCSEFDFRWSHKDKTDFEKTLLAIKGGEGKRLTYRPIKNANSNTDTLMVSKV
jgi:transposase-like protein